MELIGLFVLLWALVGGEYEWRNELPAEISATHVTAQGAFSCSEGIGWIAPDAPLSVVVHELAHAYDCLDDGELNGSPGHPSIYDWDVIHALIGWEPQPFWRAEHYAYQVVQTGRLR